MSGFLSTGQRPAGEIAGGYRTLAVVRALELAGVPASERAAMQSQLRSLPDSTRWADRRDDGQIRQVTLPYLGEAGVDRLLHGLRVRQELTGAALASATLVIAGAFLALG